MPRYRIQDFATSTHDVVGIKAAKEALRKYDFPLAESQSVVRRFFDPAKFSHLRGDPRPIVYLVAPSTSDTNILPELLAKEMQSHFPGEIVQGWATPLRSTRAALKVGIRKLREPPAFAAVPGALDHLDPNARLILVDDVVTTGSCIRALREVLSTYGKRANEVVSLGQGELRKVSEKDIDRITAKLGDPAIRPAVTGVLGGQLKHAVNYIERVFDEKTRLEISSYFNAEFARLRQLGLAHEGPAAGTPLSLAGLEGPQRHARIGAVISSGVSREGVRIRSSAQRAQGRPSDAPTIITELIELRCRWGAATLNERPKIVKKTLALVDDSGGAAVTRLPLRVAAREFVQGEDALGVLTERAQVHAATQSLTRGLVSARGRGIEQ